MMLIRRARENDLPQILDIERACFSLPWSEAGFRAELTAPESIFQVIEPEEDGTVAGFAVLRLYENAGEVYNLAVRQDARRRGLGRLVLTRAMELAEAAGMTECTLEARASNAPALALYRALGFAPVGVRKNYYDRPTEDGILMLWKDGVQI
jgi:ribosomal-protein-alanine N-acetyltransferase